MRAKSLLLALFLFALAGEPYAPAAVGADNVLRVTTKGTAEGLCGNLWDNSCELQHALTIAKGGAELWVANGTYYPTTGTDRTATFQLKSGVALYGGFVGREEVRDQRDWNVNLTVLSGDIGLEISDDNSYHVVTGSGTDASAVLDGFTISGGNANGDCFINNGCNGAGMYNQGGNPTLKNVTFGGNSASYRGGGIWNAGSPILTSVTFSGNSAGYMGGGMSNADVSSPTLTNVTFAGNSANRGAGMYNEGDLMLVNATLSNNSATVQGGGIFNRAVGMTVTVRNSILWGNSPDQFINSSAYAVDVTYSIVQGGYAGTGNSSADPVLGTLGSYGGSMQMIPLLPGSAAIDTGNPAWCPASDQRGVTRLQWGACDMGAFESRGFALAKTGGDNQSALPNTAFALPLSVSVSSTYGEPVSGGRITFTAPNSGAGATISGSPAAISIDTASVTAQANSAVGTYNVTASAVGAAPVSFSLLNGKADTTTTVTAHTPNPSLIGHGVLVSYTVGIIAPGSGTPTGYVTVSSGVDWCTGTVAEGSCSITLRDLGLVPLSASYSGDSHFSGSSTSMPVSHTVVESLPAQIKSYLPLMVK